jgi:hypothetical protein
MSSINSAAYPSFYPDFEITEDFSLGFNSSVLASSDETEQSGRTGTSESLTDPEIIRSIAASFEIDRTTKILTFISEKPALAATLLRAKLHLSEFFEPEGCYLRLVLDRESGEQNVALFVPTALDPKTAFTHWKAFMKGFSRHLRQTGDFLSINLHFK